MWGDHEYGSIDLGNAWIDTLRKVWRRTVNSVQDWVRRGND